MHREKESERVINVNLLVQKNQTHFYYHYIL